MKRFISTLCLLVGASVASYAGLITSTAGLSGSAQLQTFDTATEGSFPLNSFTTFSANGGINVQVSSSAPGVGADSSTKNTGGTAAFRDVNGNGNIYISTQDFGNATLPTTFARNITLTFTSAISEFLIDYAGNDSGNNYFLINGTTRYNFGSTANGQIGANDGGITSVTFVIYGNDSTAGTLGGADGGDRVLFNDLRVVASSQQTSGSSGSTGGPSQVPEPSTYGLIGLGLSALAYARRKK